MNALTINGVASVQIACDPTIIELRDRGLATSKQITAINTPGEYEAALITIRSLKGFTTTIETSRKAIKAEPLRITRQIDEIAASTSKPVEDEITRITDLRDGYAKREAIRQAQLQREAEEARKKREREIEEARLAELKRIQDEHNAKLKAQQDEQAKQANSNVDAFAQIKAELQAEAATEKANAELRLAQERAAKEAEAATLRAQQQAVVAPAIATKTVWRWFVRDVVKLVAARPDLVTIEPKVREINALVNAGTREIEGLEIKEEVVAK